MRTDELPRRHTPLALVADRAGRLDLDRTTPDQIVTVSAESGFELIHLEPREAATSHRLPVVPNHKDPFDRLLAWQCIQRDFILISADSSTEAYREAGLQIL